MASNSKKTKTRRKRRDDKQIKGRQKKVQKRLEKQAQTEGVIVVS